MMHTSPSQFNDAQVGYFINDNSTSSPGWHTIVLPGKTSYSALTGPSLVPRAANQFWASLWSPTLHSRYPRQHAAAVLSSSTPIILGKLSSCQVGDVTCIRISEMAHMVKDIVNWWTIRGLREVWWPGWPIADVNRA